MAANDQCRNLQKTNSSPNVFWPQPNRGNFTIPNRLPGSPYCAKLQRIKLRLGCLTLVYFLHFPRSLRFVGDWHYQVRFLAQKSHRQKRTAFIAGKEASALILCLAHCYFEPNLDSSRLYGFTEPISTSECCSFRWGWSLRSEPAIRHRVSINPWA